MGSEPSEDPRHLQPALTPPAITPATSTTSESAELHFVLDRLVRRHIEAVIPAPTIAAFGIDGKHYELLRLGVDRPEDAVLGLQLPSRFGALGVIATSVIATPPKRTLQDAALALGVTRTGQTVSLLATSDGPSTTTLNPQGWLIDACRRAVGLPTPPCSIAPVAFPIALWLDRLMVSVLNEQHPPTTWSDAVALCPVPKQWRSDDPTDLGITLGSVTPSWSRLRQATISGERSPVGLRPDHAEWMDDAMFARWCMGGFPDLGSLRGDVEFLASATVAENMDRALRAAWSTIG